MSADPEFFAYLSDCGRKWTLGWVRFVGGEPHAQLGRERLRSSDVGGLETHLLFKTGQYLSQGGHGDLTDAIRDSVFRRVVDFCAAMPVIPGKAKRVENGWLFHPVSAAARAWTRAQLAELNAGTAMTLTRDEVAPKVRELVGERLAELGKGWDEGDPEGVIRRVTGFCIRMHLRKARTKGGPARRGATKEVRIALRDEVLKILQWHDEGRYWGTFVPGPKGKPVPFKPLGKRGALSVSQVHLFHTHVLKLVDGQRTWVKTTVRTSRSAVATALKDVRGTPVRSAVIDALNSTSRDLVWAIEHDLPTSAVTVVDVDALAGRLWDRPRSTSGKANQRKRVAEGLAEIQAADIGINVAVVDQHAVIGRGRSLPGNLSRVVETAVRKGQVRALPDGFVPQRMGVWGSREGQDAQSACRVATSRAGDADVDRVAVLGGYDGAQGMIDIANGRDPERGFRPNPIARVAQSYLRRNTLEWAQTVIDRTGLGLGGDNGSPHYMVDLVKTGREHGAGGVWRKVRSGPRYTLWHADPKAKEARRRADRIEQVLDTCETVDAWEAAVHTDVILSRPGRRPTLPAQHAAPAEVTQETREVEVQREPAAAVRTTVTIIESTRPMPKKVMTGEGDFEYLEMLYNHAHLGRERDGLRELFYGASKAGDGHRPVADAEAALGYLRRLYDDLQPTKKAQYFPRIRSIDTALEGAVREGIAETGKVLRAGGPLAEVRAIQYFEAVMQALRHPEAAQELRWRIGQMRQAFADPNRILAGV